MPIFSFEALRMRYRAFQTLLITYTKSKNEI
ncbi:hypothetical protein [Salmonella phage Tennessee]